MRCLCAQALEKHLPPPKISQAHLGYTFGDTEGRVTAAPGHARFTNPAAAQSISYFSLRAMDQDGLLLASSADQPL
jgi:hypothetical protein